MRFRYVIKEGTKTIFEGMGREVPVADAEDMIDMLEIEQLFERVTGQRLHILEEPSGETDAKLT